MKQDGTSNLASALFQGDISFHFVLWSLSPSLLHTHRSSKSRVRLISDRQHTSQSKYWYDLSLRGASLCSGTALPQSGPCLGLCSQSCRPSRNTWCSPGLFLPRTSWVTRQEAMRRRRLRRSR